VPWVSPDATLAIGARPVFHGATRIAARRQRVQGDAMMSWLAAVQVEPWWILLAWTINAVVLLWLLLRPGVRELRDAWSGAHAQLAEAMRASTSRVDQLERALAHEIADSSRDARQELAQTLTLFQQTLQAQGAQSTRTQNAQIDAFGQQLTLLQRSLSDTLATQLQQLGESNTRRMAEVRQTLEVQLAQLQASNAARLEEMRSTVDEKLQATLHARLGESFKQVADRLEQVHKGLGEMQTLAQGVGDLKHLLTNVKTRGIFGEAQLEALLEQVFVADQYASQVATRPGSKAVVDFAIRLPGQGSGEQPLWLPIDAKFPNEDYERLLDAQGRADAAGVEQAGRALETRIRLEARSMSEKYLEPPYTTDFAILFLPTEGLYAEVLRRPGLMEALQREHRITLAGPSTLLAMLGALQMGFRTLALEQRASEVWRVLGAVKAEFSRFGDVLARVKSQTETVLKTIDSAQTRSRAMDRALRQVESLPEPSSVAVVPQSADADVDTKPDAIR